MKSRIERTAHRLFLRHGVEAISMRRLASENRISATAIYRHYRGKEEILTSITERGFALFREYLEGALAAPTPLDRLKALAQGYLDFALDHPRVYDFVFLVPRRNVRRFPADFIGRTDSTMHILADQIAQAMREGQLIPDDPLETALTVWAHSHGLIALHRAGRFSPRDVRERYNRSVDRLFSGLSPRSDPQGDSHEH